MKKVFADKESGFSLVELMIVVGIIGILATMAFPKFQEFQSKARMAEAKTNLSHLYTMQHSYFLENDEYQNFTAVGAGNCNFNEQQVSELGFEIQPCNNQVPRYAYATTGADSQLFNATARSKPSVCQEGGSHYFGINENKSFMGPKSCRDARRYANPASVQGQR